MDAAVLFCAKPLRQRAAQKIWLTDGANHVILLMILRDTALQSLFKAIYSGPPNGAKAIRTAGSTADRRRKLPLLIERHSSNFISWFLYNHEIARSVRRLVKRSIRVVKV